MADPEATAHSEKADTVPAPKPTLLDQLEQLSKIATPVMIPVVIAILGFFGNELINARQNAIESKKIDLEYVKIAKDILSSVKPDTDPKITRWAYETLFKLSPVAVSTEVVEELSTKRVPLPITTSVVASPEVNSAIDTAFRAAKLDPARIAGLDQIATRINSAKARYETIQGSTGVPWYVVGILHWLEAGGRFDTHLHNGDPLIARTTHVPVGRPPQGEPPFEWEVSAADALTLVRLSGEGGSFATVGSMLDHIERRSHPQTNDQPRLCADCGLAFQLHPGPSRSRRIFHLARLGSPENAAEAAEYCPELAALYPLFPQHVPYGVRH